MTALAANITATQTLIPVDAGLTNGSFQLPLYYTVDSEAIRVTGRAHRTTWLVERGIAGTTAATHSSAATLTRYYPEAATGEAGAGGVTPTLAEVLAEGNDTGGAAFGSAAIVSVQGGGSVANVSVTATHNAAQAAVANRTATSATGDAHADTTATAGGIEDASTKATATTATGNADATIRAEVTDAEGGDAFADTLVSNVDGAAQAKTTATATGDGNATADILASVEGDGLATSGVGSMAELGVNFSGLVTEADATSARMGFNGATPIAKPTGVAVTAEAIHAALVDLGLIAA